ncbi:MAG: DUF4389 domain-containing protein [Patescibacteria group bacterium]
MNDQQPQQNQYPVTFEVQYPGKSSRLLALLGVLFFLKTILLIPHIIILYFLGIAVMFVAWFAYLVILFTGEYPRSLFDFAVGVMRWQVRINAWLFSLTDKYPPFSFR